MGKTFYILLITIFITLFSSPLSALSTSKLGELIDYITSDEISKAYRILLILIIINSFIYISELLIFALREVVIIKVDKRVKKEIFSTIDNISYSTYISSDFQDDLGKVMGNTGLELVFFFENLTQVLELALKITTYIFLIYYVTGFTTVVLSIAIMIISVIFSNKINNLERDNRFANIKKIRFMNYINSIYKNISASREMLLYGYKSKLDNIVKNKSDELIENNKKVYKTTARYSFFVIIIQWAITLVGVYVIFRFQSFSSVGTVIIIYNSILSIQGLCGRFGAVYGRMLIKLKNFDYVIEFLNKYDEKKSTLNIIVPIDLKQVVSVQNVYYTYGSSFSLKNINFSICKGETVAIVGENGSGKTTLVNLLLGLYPVDSGKVEICGANPFEIKNKNDYIAIVQQHFGQYNGLTLKNNIVFGRDYETIPESKDDFIQNNLNSIVGEEFGGINFSGGQWQKIAIQRAKATSAQIVIMDEPTAALDPIAELKVFEDFINEKDIKTKIIVTHRMGIAKRADKIIVLKDGQIMETGKHADLIDMQGLYWEMYTAQAEFYQTDTATA